MFIRSCSLTTIGRPHLTVKEMMKFTPLNIRTLQIKMKESLNRIDEY